MGSHGPIVWAPDERDDGCRTGSNPRHRLRRPNLGVLAQIILGAHVFAWSCWDRLDKPTGCGSMGCSSLDFRPSGGTSSMPCRRRRGREVVGYLLSYWHGVSADLSVLLLLVCLPSGRLQICCHPERVFVQDLLVFVLAVTRLLGRWLLVFLALLCQSAGLVFGFCLLFVV